MSRTESRQPRIDLAVCLFTLGCFVLLGLCSVMRHRSGHSYFYDLGVMDNAVWQTLRGRLLFFPQYDTSFFGDHFAPILLVFVPLYAVWADPAVLLLGQALALASGAPLVFRITLRHFDRAPLEAGLEPAVARRVAWIFMLLYACSPSLLHIAMFDFHPIAFMIPLSLAAYWLYLEQRRVALAICLLAMAACKEEAAITIAAFGLFMVLFGRSSTDRKFGALTIGAAGLYFALVMKVVIPSFHPPGADFGWVHLSRYAHLGESITEIATNVLLHPFDAIASSWGAYKLETLAFLLLPLGLLPLLGWRALLVAAPALAYTYLSGRPHQFVIYNQYFSPTLGWLSIAAVEGLGRWLKWRRSVAARPAAGLRLGGAALPLIVALVATIAADRDRRPIKLQYFTGHRYRAELDRLHRIVGPDASLSVTNRLAPSFAHRRDYYLALDFAFNRSINAALGLPDYRDTTFHLIDLTALEGSRDRERRVAALLADPRYGVRYYRFPLVLFERDLRSPDPPELQALLSPDVGDDAPDVLRAFPAVFLNHGNDREVKIDLGDAGRGAVLRFVAGRRGRAKVRDVLLPPGRYAVAFHIKLDRVAEGTIADLAVSSGYGRSRQASRRLLAGDFAGASGYRSFSLDFALDRETEGLEFVVRSRGVGFSLRKIVLRRGRDDGSAPAEGGGDGAAR